MSAPFTTVLKTEHQHLRQRRGEPLAPADDDPIQDAHHLKPFGVSFSGGGIRSATFNLGIIQGLAESNLLSRIDYLSTVSGGGYIGSWLHGFIKNHCKGSLERASDELSPTDNPVPTLGHPDPVTFLRKYSNYLAPRPGLFSADTWVIGTIWVRNVLLNQLILVPALGAVVLAAFLFYFLQLWPVAEYIPNIPFVLMPLLAMALLALTLPIAIRNLRDIVRRCGLPQGAAARGGQPLTGWRRNADPWLVPILIFLAAVVLACGDTGARIEANIASFRSSLGLLGLMFFAILFVLQTFGGFRLQYEQTHKEMSGALFWKNAHPVWMSAVCAALMVALLHLLWTYDKTWTDWARVTLGPPLVTGAIFLSVSLQIGLMGADYPDGAREWLARNGALLALASAAWLAVFGIAFYGPYLVALALANYGKTTMAAIAAWIGTGAAGVYAGSSSRTSASDETGKSKSGPLDWLVGLAPPLVMAGYLLLVSLGVHQAFVATLDIPSRPPQPPAAEALQVDVRVPPPAEPVEISINRSAVGALDRLFTRAEAFKAGYHDAFAKGDDIPGRAGRLFLLLLGCVVIAGIASARININEFSLHNFYKNRLVRCYLGASNASTRQPNRLTGFDPQDDFALSELTQERGYPGPYPIVNTTLNINVGSELSQQERKGASFVMTPAYCGFHVQDSSAHKPEDSQFEPDGYRQTREGKGEMGYSDPKGPTVGQAMAISGAAASPNAGYTTSGPMAFLLTIFDARLGWWLGNPRWKDASRLPGPSFSLKYLLAELIANTTARTRFVNLSDGGHFDNLGLYELVRRRCRYIIVGDGEQDGALTFGSLGGAVRKCRADFGVEIDIDPTPIKITKGHSTAHCVIGTILYPEFDPTVPQPTMSKISDSSTEKSKFVQVRPATKYARGWLLYLKSSITGNEPADVLQYQSENPEFPHQSTGDQFFSESQFESYRRLGLHIIREAFEGVVAPRTPGEDRLVPLPALQTVFQDLTTKWYAKIPMEPASASRLNDSYSEFVKRLGADGLKDLLGGALADVKPPAWTGTEPTEEQFVYIVEQLGLMENVFFEFQFEHRAHRANPRSRGWMTVFRQWAHNPVLYEGVWPRVKHTYNPVFQDFIKRLHDDEIDDVPIQN
jgi:hypothetical protein